MPIPALNSSGEPGSPERPSFRYLENKNAATRVLTQTAKSAAGVSALFALVLYLATSRFLEKRLTDRRWIHIISYGVVSVVIQRFLLSRPQLLRRVVYPYENIIELPSGAWRWIKECCASLASGQ